MNIKNKLCVLLCIFFGFSNLIAQDEKKQININELGSMQGYVFGKFAYKYPLSGAKIVIAIKDDSLKKFNREYRSVARVYTDSNGFFKANGLSPGEYLLTIDNIDEDIGMSNHKEFKTIITKNQQLALDTIIVLSELYRPAQSEKPIIYLYPGKKQKIDVKLNYKGTLTHTYPKYENGWHVTAMPNGTLIDDKGIEYYALYWEGKSEDAIIPKDGFIIKGKETVTFLEEKLFELGLNRREANEFIVYWIPKLENNEYNLIHFAGDPYLEQAILDIKPAPESVIRVMMLYKPLNEKIDFPKQDLSKLKKARKGYTVVEWGGTLIETPIEFVVK